MENFNFDMLFKSVEESKISEIAGFLFKKYPAIVQEYIGKNPYSEDEATISKEVPNNVTVLIGRGKRTYLILPDKEGLIMLLDSIFGKILKDSNFLEEFYKALKEKFDGLVQSAVFEGRAKKYYDHLAVIFNKCFPKEITGKGLAKKEIRLDNNLSEEDLYLYLNDYVLILSSLFKEFIEDTNSKSLKKSEKAVISSGDIDTSDTLSVSPFLGDNYDLFLKHFEQKKEPLVFGNSNSAKRKVLYDLILRLVYLQNHGGGGTCEQLRLEEKS